MPLTRFEVARETELPAGEMKEVEADGRQILLAHTDSGFCATGAKCPHYGASLAEGVLCEDRVICPWHKAVFRVTDGALLEPPAMDALVHYDVTIEDGRVFVHLPETEQPPARKAMTDDRCFVLAGAGAAGTAAAENLRRLGFDGRIVLLSGEPELPYDRTKLSKEFLSGNAGEEELPLRPAEFWDEHRVERITQRVTAVKVGEQVVILEDGSTLTYDRLLLATGSAPAGFDVPGSDLGGIFALRSQSDAARVLEGAKPGARVAIVGGSFIALEAASCLAMRKMPVTVVVPEETPFAKQLGPAVGSILQRWHESHGVVFRLKARVKNFEGTGIVRTVVLESGEEIPADVVLVGTGVRPITRYTDELSKREDGGIVADSRLEATQAVYVAGDLAVFDETYSGLSARIEHWRLAEQHGRIAAQNMLGQEEPFAGVPYFWTNHFGTRFDHVGHAPDWDEIILEEGEDAPTFLAFYVKQGRVTAAAACQRDQEIAALHELIRLRRVPSPSDIRKGVDLVALARKGGKG